MQQTAVFKKTSRMVMISDKDIIIKEKIRRPD